MNADSYGDALDCTLKEITKLHKTIAAQAAVIEKLREGLKVAGMNCVDDFIAAGALQLADTIPTDSTQILAEVRRAERERVYQVADSAYATEHVLLAIRAME